MAAIHDLLAQVQDEALRSRLEQEINRLSKTKKFGLVFEEHLPECTPLYDIPVKKGSLAAKKTGSVSEIYEVCAIKDGIATCCHKVTKEKEEIPVDDLVCVARFGEPIYPYLKLVDSVRNGGDSDPWHTLIEADNYHALQLLEYLYAGKVDCIYIDPPYNTGARDWKYNNHYVDSNDAYRHSKWLSFMEKRLRLARKILNPGTGVIVIAIDDNELNSLGLLIDEVFDGYKKFCITVVHNPNGNQGKNFGITNEFLFFVLPSGDQLLSLENRVDAPDIRPLRDVSGNSNLRTDARNCFYPIYVKDQKIAGFGDVCEDSFHPCSANIEREDGVTEIYPIDASGIEKKWVFARNTVESITDELQIEWNNSRKIWDVIRYKTHFTYKSVWNKKAYNANSYGTKLLNKILGEKRFDYPKSVYGVYECLKAVCGNKKDALVVDFFSGSGTTLHALNLLNAEDKGHRRCIMITNNEVSEAEARSLAKKGLKPGDDAWEKYGIARYVTWPRTVCSIKGINTKGQPLPGDYGTYHEEYIPDTGAKGKYRKVKAADNPVLADMKMSDGFKANAAFFKLGFLDKTSVALGRQLAQLLPVLWLKAGAVGPCPQLKEEKADMLVLPENHFAILIDEKYYQDFAVQIDLHPEIRTIYIVTDSEAGYREMITGYTHRDTYQLYRDYLDNFRINTGRQS